MERVRASIHNQQPWCSATKPVWAVPARATVHSEESQAAYPSVADWSWRFAGWSHCTMLSWHFINNQSHPSTTFHSFSSYTSTILLSLPLFHSTHTSLLSLSLSLFVIVFNCITMTHPVLLSCISVLPLFLCEMDRKRNERVVNKWLTVCADGFHKAL